MQALLENRQDKLASFRHGLTYEAESITPVQHIADSLIANERLLNEAIYILGSLGPVDS